MGDLLTTLREAGAESVPACPLCSAAGAIDARWGALLSLREPFGVARCDACRHRWLTPRPSQKGVDLLYSSEFYFEPEDLPEYATFAEQRADHFRDRAKKMVDAKPGLSLLDYGSATGDFVAAAAAVGAQAYGIEVSADARAIAMDRGIRLHAPNEEHLLPKSFDAIHMNHVLEHMPDPVEHLKWCRSRLTPGGLVCIEVPHQFDNDTDRLRRAMGAGGQQDKFDAFSVHHTQFFTPKSLRRAVESTGFQIQKLVTPIAPTNGYASLKRRIIGAALRVANIFHHGGDVIELWAVRQ